jgi:hypothetical protein
MVWLDLGYFWMTGTRTVSDCLETAVFNHFACDFIESKPIGALHYSHNVHLAYIKGLKTIGIYY